MNGRLVFTPEMVTAEGPAMANPVSATSLTMNMVPMKLPMYETIQFLSS